MSAAIGRYLLGAEIASGGMATVHFGRLRADGGFSRTVAIKRLHPNLAIDPSFVSMLRREARVVSRVRHPHVVPILDVVIEGDDMCLIMEYVHGLSLSQILRLKTAEAVPLLVAAAIVSGILHGLHAAHEATDEAGSPIAIVHRDVSPQNILVGKDGAARITDFGIARAADQLHTTREGFVKGKIRYMAPEQLRGPHVDRRTDIYAATVVLWECLSGMPLFTEKSHAALIQQVLVGPDRTILERIPEAARAIVARGLSADPSRRFDTAQAMALELEEQIGVATAAEVSMWLEHVAAGELAARDARLRAVEMNEHTSTPLEGGAVAWPAEPATLVDRPVRAPKETDASEALTEIRGGPTGDLESTAPRRNTRLVAVAGATAGVLIALSVARMISTSDERTRFPSGPMISTSAGGSSATTTVASANVDEDTPAPAASGVSPPPTARTKRTTGAPRGATSTHGVRKSPAPCDPPFETDANGIRRVKLGCGQSDSVSQP